MANARFIGAQAAEAMQFAAGQVADLDEVPEVLQVVIAPTLLAAADELVRGRFPARRDVLGRSAPDSGDRRGRNRRSLSAEHRRPAWFAWIYADCGATS